MRIEYIFFKTFGLIIVNYKCKYVHSQLGGWTMKLKLLIIHSTLANNGSNK